MSSATVTIREGGWVRVTLPAGEAAVRFDLDLDGDLRVGLLLVIPRDDRSVDRLASGARAAASEFAAENPEALRPHAKHRAELPAAERDRLDREMLAEPLRRSSWGLGVEAETLSMRARSVVDAPAGPDLVLDIPAERFKPHRFYEQVARLYLAVRPASPNPARVIADANEVPVEVVYRWVNEARRRKIIPLAREEHE